MIIVDAGLNDIRSFDAKILFATQLSHQGYLVAIDENTIPQDIDRIQKYEVAPYLTDVSGGQVSGLVLIGAEEISDETLMTLRSYNLAADVTVSALGRFADYQAFVGASSKIAFALGREANVVDLNELQKKQILRTSITPLSASGVTGSKSWSNIPELFLFLPSDLLEDAQILQIVAAINCLAEINLNVISTGTGKSQVVQSKYSGLSVYGLTELPSAVFAKLADIAVFFGDSVPGERMGNFALDLMKSSGVLIDCTVSGTFVASGAPALRGPEDLAALPNYLMSSVLPNRKEIGRQASENPWLESNSIERLTTALKLPLVKSVPATRKKISPNTIFIPTNGAGLGHAQRCSLIAAAMDQPELCRFAAFPKCIPLIANKGYSCTPLVQKSAFHVDENANDLVNYLRLRRTFRDGDSLVFDGGHVFDSVYRTIMEKSLSATWIRRGLWQAGQIRESSFDREKAFDQIIVPNEAFDELNTAYTLGKNIHQVGPIVQQSTRPEKAFADIRRKLKSKFDNDFDQLVITMLGAGVSSDRSAQILAVCAQLERRPNCLHLVVIWPGSNISAALNGWNNSHVVTTVDALALCGAADFVISAAGYNSFHEILYHEIPAIFIPQAASYLDDQEKRARSASERGLAATVLPNEFLKLEREVAEFLDGDRPAQIKTELGSVNLPARGNDRAAALISAGAKP